MFTACILEPDGRWERQVPHSAAAAAERRRPKVQGTFRAARSAAAWAAKKSALSRGNVGVGTEFTGTSAAPHLARLRLACAPHVAGWWRQRRGHESVRCTPPLARGALLAHYLLLAARVPLGCGSPTATPRRRCGASRLPRVTSRPCWRNGNCTRRALGCKALTPTRHWLTPAGRTHALRSVCATWPWCRAASTWCVWPLVQRQHSAQLPDILQHALERRPAHLRAAHHPARICICAASAHVARPAPPAV